jgi:mRNA-degrading endonuclease toxin of MazEF toxin-antitoxin module
MTYVNAGNARTGLVGLAVAVALTAGFSGDAAAKHRSHVALTAQEQTIQTVSVQETARPVGMRYYGGPKSSMWSGQ